MTLAAVYVASKTKDNEVGTGRKKAQAVFKLLDSRLKERSANCWEAMDALKDVEIISKDAVDYIKDLDEV